MIYHLWSPVFSVLVSRVGCFLRCTHLFIAGIHAALSSTSLLLIGLFLPHFLIAGLIGFGLLDGSFQGALLLMSSAACGGIHVLLLGRSCGSVSLVRLRIVNLVINVLLLIHCLLGEALMRRFAWHTFL